MARKHSPCVCGLLSPTYCAGGPRFFTSFSMYAHCALHFCGWGGCSPTAEKFGALTVAVIERGRCAWFGLDRSTRTHFETAVCVGRAKLRVRSEHCICSQGLLQCLGDPCHVSASSLPCIPPSLLFRTTGTGGGVHAITGQAAEGDSSDMPVGLGAPGADRGATGSGYSSPVLPFGDPQAARGSVAGLKDGAGTGLGPLPSDPGSPRGWLSPEDVKGGGQRRRPSASGSPAVSPASVGVRAGLGLGGGRSRTCTLVWLYFRLRDVGPP